MTRVCCSVVGLVLTWVAGIGAAQPPDAADYVPVSSLPRTEALPAAPMVMAAYACVWVALAGYVWYLWRRQRAIEAEMADLERRVASQE